jgi:FixJ family two-component response regulator
MNERCSPVVHIVDDDPAVREAVSSLLRSTGLRIAAFESVGDFIANGIDDNPGCIVLDVRMPGESGLDLQRELLRRGDRTPIVFITGHGDIPMAVAAMKLGAAEFLPKPFREHELLDAVWAAIRRREEAERTQTAISLIRARYDALTEREREVLEQIVDGRLNKQVGSALGVSEQTIKVHRHNVMRKMQATSLPDLVRMVEAIRHEEPSRHR